jgi:hypothetical protein
VTLAATYLWIAAGLLAFWEGVVLAVVSIL